MSDEALAVLDQSIKGGNSPPPASALDVLDQSIAGKKLPVPEADAPQEHTWAKWLYSIPGAGLVQRTGESLAGTGATVVAGVKGLAEAPFIGWNAASQDIEKTRAALTPTPVPEAERDPLLGLMGGASGLLDKATAGPNEKFQSFVEQHPALEVALPATLDAAQNIANVLGVAKAVKQYSKVNAQAKSFAQQAKNHVTEPTAKPDIPTAGTTPSGTPIPAEPSPLTASGHPRSAFWEPSSDTGKVVDSEPVTGGVRPEYRQDRAQILDRVGIETARESALNGDAKAAATDWQIKKFDEPAGKAAFEQFEAEKQALNKFSTNIVRDTGGTLGLDEDSLSARGQTISAPFDNLRQWFKTQRKNLYNAADQRSGGAAVVNPSSLEEMLNDRSFNNKMTARGQTHMVNGIKAELERFKEVNGGILTVQQAEEFRQFMNTIWSPDNSSIIKSLKGALDKDVLKDAGDDLYGPARAMAQLEKQTLDNPNGITKLFDTDPQNPINRTTAFEKIPDTLTRLSADQFRNVVDTLKGMPQALQPQAQAALSEIKAQLANKVLDTGASTQGQWNALKVSDLLKKNSAKLRIVFADEPATLAKLQDLDAAGRILKVDQSYPGAAAQAANALKRGFMSQAVSRVASGAGALAGSYMGPLGSMGGAVAGEHLGGKLGASMAERKALSTWNESAVKLKDMLEPGEGVRK